jgi:tRNA threonylcarbamoyladenosine biosynthesis protein TsaE
MASRAREIAQELGFTGLQLEARMELPATINFWRNLGYVEAERDGHRLTMLRMLPIAQTLRTPEETRAFGEHLAERLRPGDLVILTGDLGAGKTTLTQGIGTGLGVRGAITSPTFVIARVHPSLSDGPELVHVDAYRLGGSAELDDLDLDTDLDEAVTVVEWGEGLAESLSVDRLELSLRRDAEHDERTITVTPVGPRWREFDMGSVGSLTSG